MTQTETGTLAQVQKTAQMRTKPYEKTNQKGIYRAYTPAEVIDGWKQIVLSRGPSPRAWPASLKRPGKRTVPNVAYLQWIHIETGFFPTVIPRHLAQLRLEMLEGDYLEVCAAFSDWFKQNPFKVVPDADETGKRELPELVPMTLTAACEALGVNPQSVRRCLQRARVAVLTGSPCPNTPNVWKPAGSPAMTTIAEIARWKDQEAA